jgi:hypothetical protein
MVPHQLELFPRICVFKKTLDLYLEHISKTMETTTSYSKRRKPLHDERMSIPMTCTPHKDWLFYVLYCGDSLMISDIIRQCIKNIGMYYENDPEIVEILTQYLPKPADSLLYLRSKLFILLNEDETTRRELVEKQKIGVGYFGPIPLSKANRFYVTLHSQIIPQWVSNEDITLSDLIDNLRMAYLIS